MENQQEQENMSAEQLAQRKADMLNFYKDSVPYLEAQLNYEDMLLKIDEARFKRSSIAYQFAMMTQNSETPETPEEDDLDIDSEPVRKLKTK
tara:strand:+ start:40 stop:315 length:276 start_codon:yes stop_codon:yes gene_type:complete